MLVNDVPQFGAVEHPMYIKERVKKIASSLRSRSNQNGKVPFDPYRCAASFGLVVQEVPLPRAISGRLRMDLSPPTIEVKREEIRVRKHYTVCHELAHLCFFKETPALPRERGEIEKILTVQKREERICDMIAAELLMPETRFLRCAKLMDSPSFDAITSLARTFDVSIATVLQRIRETRSWSIGVLDCEIDVDNGGFHCRSKWISVCRAVRSAHLRLEISLEIARALDATERFLKTRPESIARCVNLRFRDLKVYLLRYASKNRLRAIALRHC